MIAGIAGDPDATRTVYGVVIGLAVVGVALLVVAIWLFRQTKVDPELLAPLERMDDRRWASRDPATQRRMLDEVRPEGAEPLHRERPVPAIDEEFEAELHPVAGFDDLKDVEVVLTDVELVALATGEEAPEEGAAGEDLPERDADAARDVGTAIDHEDRRMDREPDDDVAVESAGSDAAGEAADEVVSESDVDRAAEGDEPDSGDRGDEVVSESEVDSAAEGEAVSESGVDRAAEGDEPESGDRGDEVVSESDVAETTHTGDEDADVAGVGTGDEERGGRPSAVSSAQD